MAAMTGIPLPLHPFSRSAVRASAEQLLLKRSAATDPRSGTAVAIMARRPGSRRAV